MGHQKISFLVLLISLTSVKADIEDDAEPVVQIEQGLVKGLKVESVRGLGHEFYAFLGIPYAKPPIGELRFKEPQPPDPWEGIYDTQQEGHMCPQRDYNSDDVTGKEDCLYANVFTNKLPNGENAEQAAVMVFIHGGAFAGGSGSAVIYGPDHLMMEGIVLVSINYRLGFLGFMCINADCLPCNNGLRDQVLALQWVQKNIARFGGDPKKVTIFGESAGAASVHYLMLSPLAKGLFHRAISESGTSTTIWAYEEPENVRFLTIQLGEMIGCNDKDSLQLLKCLQSKTLSDIINATNIQATDPMNIIIYKPTREDGKCGDVFLSERPDELLSSGTFSDVPFIIGVNSNEALAFISYTKDYWKYPSEYLEKYVSLITRKSQSDVKADALKIRKFYFGDGEVTNEMQLNFTYLFSDMCFVVATNRALKKHASTSSSPVYYYYFQYEGQLNFMRELLNINFPGATHADELGYLFHTALLVPVDEDSDEMITLFRMVKMWTNFAKTGDPTSEMNEFLNVKWQSYTMDKMMYLDINKDLSMQSNLLPERMALWDEIIGPI
ncbi:Esterase FE4 [Blattella germanica]|nr:Esterase FE4 [Blattella germanica]